ncbi:MAG: hypothetical protein JNK30_12115 [Phenylobacterium sp.]|uniref:hypothetical protein n=1 Tax=Phenylobacterium sp. TaxID=1871053 RepID=UPI001A3ACAA9|nr:hypothetical protein [Phenylobacterium sp.]MBL8772118.1 hypothetical protein [Phenylobacterium sp.]
MSQDAARTDRELRMVEAMVDCAFELGRRVGEAAKTEANRSRSLQLYDVFHRSFQAVRLGIRLCLALRAGRMAPLRPAPVQAIDAGREREDEIQVERPERGDPVERERERDYEAVSLPKFLSTLGLVARETARADGVPADVRTRNLPALEALLAKAGAAQPQPAAPAATVLDRAPPAAPRARSALLGSTAPGLRLKPPWPS